MSKPPRFAPGRHWPAFAAAALALLTLLFFTQYDGFEPRSGNLLGNGDFSQGLRGWHQRGASDAVRAVAGTPGYAEISNNDPSRSVHLWQAIGQPGRFDYVSVEFELWLEDVARGQRPEQQARIILASYDSAGNGLWHHPHIVLVADGSRGWTHYRASFPVGHDVHEMRLNAELKRATGRLRVRGLSLRGAAAEPAWLAWRALLIALWAVLGLVLARNLLSARPGRWAGLVAIALAAVFLLGTLSPKQFQHVAENEIVSWFAADQESGEVQEKRREPASSRSNTSSAKPHAPRPPDFELLRPGKFAHLLLFALFGGALALSRPGAAARTILASLLLAAAVAEMLQFFAHGRTPALEDIAINALGAFAGGGVMLLALRFGLDRVGLRTP